MTRYLQVHLAVNPAILATMLLIWNVWDAINDPLMGSIMDIVFARSKHGKDKFRPWILASIPVLLFGTIGFFLIPSHLGGGWAIGLSRCFCLKIVSEAGYTMMNIAMGSLLGAMSTNDTERATLSSARGMGSTLGNAVTGIIVPQLIARFGDSAQGYGYTALVVVPLGAIIIFTHYALTVERNVSAQQAQQSDNPQAKLNIKDIWGIFARNRAFLALVLHSISITAIQALGTGMATYMYADVLGDIGLQSYASLLSSIIQIVILLSAPLLTRKWDLVSIIRFCLASGIVVYAGLMAYLLMVPVVSPWVYIIVYSIASGLIIMSVQMQWGLVAEAIDYNEYKTGKRSEGTIYGFFSLSRRIGGTVTGSITVLLIAAIGYDASLTAQGLPQSDFTISGIEICNVGFPMLAAILSFCCFTFLWNLKGDLRKKLQDWKEGNGPAEYELNK